MVSLENQANSYSRSLSGGMKRRLLMAKAMVHQPPILVLDEPTAGVDVELKKKLWDNIKFLNEKGSNYLNKKNLNNVEKIEQILNKMRLLLNNNKK